MDRHSKELKSYFKKKSASSVSTVQSSRVAAGSGRQVGVSLSSTAARSKPSSGAANRLPDELLLRLLGYVDLAALVAASQVCRHWTLIAQDNSLWRRHLPRRIPGQDPGQPLQPEQGYYKRLCLKSRAWERRKSGALRLVSKRKDPFSGLAANIGKALDELHLRYRLELLLDDKSIFSVYDMDCKQFSMTSCVRFQSSDWPAAPHTKSVRLFSVCLLYDSAGKRRVLGPCRESLLYEGKMDLRSVLRLPAAGRDSCLEVRQLVDGWTLATFLDGRDLAWICVNLHHFSFVQRVTHGHTDSAFRQAALRVPSDDVDSRLGLYGYSCCLELRNFRNSLLREQFRDQESQNITEGFAVMSCITSDKRWQHVSLTQKPRLLWKTDCFKGVVEGVCILDVTLVDADGLVVWSCKDMVVMAPEEDSQTLDYQGQAFVMQHSDEAGSARLQLVWMEEEEKGFITSLDVSLSLAHINAFYGTTY